MTKFHCLERPNSLSILTLIFLGGQVSSKAQPSSCRSLPLRTQNISLYPCSARQLWCHNAPWNGTSTGSYRGDCGGRGVPDPLSRSSSPRLTGGHPGGGTAAVGRWRRDLPFLYAVLAKGCDSIPFHHTLPHPSSENHHLDLCRGSCPLLSSPLQATPSESDGIRKKVTVLCSPGTGFSWSCSLENVAVPEEPQAAELGEETSVTPDPNAIPSSRCSCKAFKPLLVWGRPTTLCPWQVLLARAQFSFLR